MIINFIKKYVDKLSIDDVYNFSSNNGVQLKSYEADFILEKIKKDWYNLIYDTDNEILKIKDKLEPTTYLKIKELVTFYKNKYNSYL